jgi:hypothetical protein
MLLALIQNEKKLIGGSGAYNGDFDDPKMVTFLENKGVPVFGIGLGAEVQFLDFMSVEPGIQASYENVEKNYSTFSLLPSLSVKFPLKFFSGFVPEPYISVAYPMRIALEKEIFTNPIPMLAYGGGIQAAVKMEKNSALFFEVGYMYFGETGIKNYFGEFAENPKVIEHNYSLVSFKVGYKYGFFNRKR